LNSNDHLRLPKAQGETLILTTQFGKLFHQRIFPLGFAATSLGGEARQGTRVPLSTPVRPMRRVKSFSTQQFAHLARRGQAVRFFHNPQLAGRFKTAAPSFFRNFGLPATGIPAGTSSA